MTESDGDASSNGSQSKKRRIPGACDICKRKKVRCDSGTMPDNRCSHCVQFGFECTHREVTKTLGSAKCYVESLEARLEKMDKLLNKLLPGIDVNQEVERIDKQNIIESEIPPAHEDELLESLTLPMRRLNLALSCLDDRYFGKSSNFTLLQTALDLRGEYTGDISYPNSNPTVFYEIPAWATKNPELEEKHSSYIYPDADLMASLIDDYFLHFNIFMPLLHRPTFEKSVAEGLHFSDPMFGATLLLVCAHGSRYSDDPRVLVDGSDNPRSSGWKWYDQVNVFRTTFHKRPTLYELQMHALYVLYAQSSETPQGTWAQVGLALRLSQEVGAHRRKGKKDVPPSAEDELWKRAFWVLLSLDRYIGSLYGRHCGLNDEDFDLDLPLECDDEYWDDGFQQPSGTPSSIAYFNSFLGLMDILAYAMRLIYPIRLPNSKIMNVPARSEQQIIAQLDSAMNNWKDTVPCHLKWNPNIENPLFLKQSAALYATYYHLQIFIHRPFIPSPRNTIRAAFPSLAICTNAARSCCHILESLSKWGALPTASIQITAFTSAVVLLLNIWSGKRSGYPNSRGEMQDVRRCMQVLGLSEKKWACAGRYLYLLRELACAGDLSILDIGPVEDTPRKKRPRDDPSDICTPVSPQVSPDPSRNMAGTRRVSINCPPYVQHPANFSLPAYSNEERSPPVYGQFQFSEPPVRSSDDLVNLIPGPMDTSSNMQDAYLSNPSFEGQMMDDNQNNNGQMPVTSSDFNAIGSGFDLDILSWFGAIPTMDNTTMAVWSAAPTNVEMDDWKSYIHNFEQMTQEAN